MPLTSRSLKPPRWTSAIISGSRIIKTYPGKYDVK